MEEAQTAVPVWIMPTYRVVESFDPATTMFDVVIVDESSQCDLFGLAALGIARKAVVVGDDKQISPQAVGTDESAVHELIRQHIPDLPQAELLDIKTSLYDLSKMRFPGVIMLREHFRCLPEIIEFSNQLAYGNAILPLREQPADPPGKASSTSTSPMATGSQEPTPTPQKPTTSSARSPNFAPIRAMTARPSASSRSSATPRRSSFRESSSTGSVSRKWNGGGSAAATPTTSRATNGTSCSCPSSSPPAKAGASGR